MNCPHCNVHIDEHPASRCLAVWVAVDVMEWEKTEQRPVVLKDWLDYPQEWYKTPDGRIVNIINIPDYPGSIAAAWEVAQKMAEQWPDFSIGSGWYKECHGKWSVSWGFDGHGWEWTEPCDTAPLAICRAAIKATLLDNSSDSV